jgi:hypothetical protein
VDRALAELVEIDRGAQRAADEALDLLGAAADLAFPAVALGVGAGMHRVLGGNPAFVRALEEIFDAVFDGGGDEHLGAAAGDHHRALGVALDSCLDGDGTERVVVAAVGARLKVTHS